MVVAQRKGLRLAQGFLKFGGEFVYTHGKSFGMPHSLGISMRFQGPWPLKH
jgi:hypothetical protein